MSESELLRSFVPIKTIGAQDDKTRESRSEHPWVKAAQMINAIFNHPWQSMVFVIVAALLTLAFRRNRTQVRLTKTLREWSKNV